MANKIKFKRGLKSKLPTLEAGEPAFLTDTGELFVGTGSGNVNMGGSQWYTGTAISGTSATTGAYSYSECPLVKLGDIYLNTSNGNVYQCTTAGSGTTAKWTYKGCLRGAPGSSATVDASLSETSTNPVQNKVVKAAFDSLPCSVRDDGTNDTEVDADHIIAEKELEVIGDMYLDGDIEIYNPDNDTRVTGHKLKFTNDVEFNSASTTFNNNFNAYSDIIFDRNDQAKCGFLSLDHICTYLFNLINEAKSHGWNQSLPDE
ncbi:MAG: hypothetical protein IJP58_04780 [Clostridia bacterium]|nr:hypothetical protein [Clostridia bacterium]MBR0027942.1 hypothetical protein [Clostridia bacterium]MBR0469972.1 hypothetical protein [Clostridia bacterium]